MSEVQSRSIQGRYKWTYIKGRESEFPELYLLHSDLGDRIKVEVNRARKQVRISADTHLGNHIQATISNGVIIREKDLHTGKHLNLDEYFADLHIELSSLPDSQVLGIIGGNYKVLTEFLGTIKAREVVRPTESSSRLLWQWLAKYPQKFWKGCKSVFRAVFDRPSLWDALDIGLIGSVAWMSYIWNFNLLFAGFMTCITTLATGVADWALRNRAPYILKVFAFMGPGLAAIYLGLRLQ